MLISFYHNQDPWRGSRRKFLWKLKIINTKKKGIVEIGIRAIEKNLKIKRRRVYDVIPVIIGLRGLEHSNKNCCYVIKDKDELEELKNLCIGFLKVQQEL